MAWARLDDGWRSHPKIKRAVHLAGHRSVKYLWVEGLSEVNERRTDGVLPVYLADDVFREAGVAPARRAAFTQALIDAGLWHDHRTIEQCGRCKRAVADTAHGPLLPGDVYYHDILDYQQSKDDQASPEGKMSKARMTALRADRELCQEIYARDKGLCRYCGIRVDTNPNNRSGKRRLTRDHIDPGCFTPNGGNFLAGVVLACGDCNRRKGKRTPEEAGMRLLDPGTMALGLGGLGDTEEEQGSCDLGPESAQADEADPSSPRGSGRVGAGSEPGRAGPGRGGPGRTGKGRTRARAGSGGPPSRPDRPP